MILSEIDDKVLTLAILPYVPNDQVIEMATGVAGDHDKVRLVVQLQILRRDGLEVESAMLLSMENLSALLHLGRAVGKSLPDMTKTVDGWFEEYRHKVRSKK